MDTSEAYDRDVTYYLELSKKIVFTCSAGPSSPSASCCSDGDLLLRRAESLIAGRRPSAGHLTTANYYDLFFQTEFPTHMYNTVVVAGSSTILSLSSAPWAPTPEPLRFLADTLVSRVALVSYMLPEVLLVLPLFTYVVWAGLADTLLS